MMVKPQTTPIRRYTALCIFFLLPVSLLALSIEGILQANKNGQDLLVTEQRFDQYRQRTDNSKDRPIELSRITSVFVKAGSRSLAEVEAQSQLISIVEAAMARMIESGAGDVEEAAASEIVEIRATFDADNPALLRILYAIETRVPFMNIEELAIHRLDRAASDDLKSPMLRVDLAIRAHWKNLVP